MKRQLTPTFFQSVLNDIKKEIENKTLQTTPFCNKHRLPYIIMTVIRKLGYYTKSSGKEFIWISQIPTEKDGLRVQKAFLKHRKPISRKHLKRKIKKTNKVKTQKQPKQLKTTVVHEEIPHDGKYLSFIKKMLQNKSKEELIDLLLSYI